mgnify:CR=1 FL=1
MAVPPVDALPLATGVRVRQLLGASWRSYAVLGAITAFLLALLIIPVSAVFITAFRDGDGSFTLGHSAALRDRRTFRSSVRRAGKVCAADCISASLLEH